ncbi:MAG: ClbS/DfsB family four-helix bundle protein [Thermomicrobiales bacterium]
MTEETAPSKGQVLAAIDREREAWEATLAEVGEARMLEPGAMGDWTFKDLVAHLTGWRAWGLRRLEATANGQPQPDPAWPAHLTSDDEINAWIHAQNQERLLGEVVAESRESYARLAEIVQMLPDVALHDPNSLPNSLRVEGNALGPLIISGAFFSHWHEDHEPGIRCWLQESA